MKNFTKKPTIIAIILGLLLILTSCDTVVLLTVQAEHPTEEQMCKVGCSFINRNDKEIQIGCRKCEASKIKKFARNNNIKILSEKIQNEFTGYDTYSSSYPTSFYNWYSSSSVRTSTNVYYFTFSTDDINVTILD